ncbi:MAG: hypothetical protein SW833_11935 [Cyanobacteriota bacterium]|nr:hypothetical protein [Cyanobacteriota bacterium]
MRLDFVRSPVNLTSPDFDPVVRDTLAFSAIASFQLGFTTPIFSV